MIGFQGPFPSIGALSTGFGLDFCVIRDRDGGIGGLAG